MTVNRLVLLIALSIIIGVVIGIEFSSTDTCCNLGTQQ
jgi:hypothetical protein